MKGTIRCPALQAGTALLALALLPGAGVRALQDPERTQPESSASASLPAEEPARFLELAARAWQSRDLTRWMALWDPPNASARTEEEELARTHFAAEETSLHWLRGERADLSADRLFVDAQVFTTTEPKGQLAYWRLTAVRRPAGWAFVRRSGASIMDGLQHLGLGSRAWRARDLTLHFEDFEVRMHEGTLFSNPEPLGPTVLVFVGKGRVHYLPRPATEREQLRRFAGGTTLDEPVSWAFVRINPLAFGRVVDEARLVPDPDAVSRLDEAQRVFSERVVRSFMLDAPLPRSPWWLMPNLSDAVIDFPMGRRHVLTYAISANDSEDLNLFDRDRKLQICAYQSEARAAGVRRMSQPIDVLEQDLHVRFDPERLALTGVHRMRIGPVSASTLRLKLDEDFKVSSIATADGTGLLFFRVRGQGSLVVSLGPVEHEQPFTLVTRYAGEHNPAPVENELVQLGRNRQGLTLTDVMIDPPPIVYSNRTAWYPRAGEEEFSPVTATLETPEGWVALTGGELRSLRSESRLMRAEYVQKQPGKFVTAIVGRLSDLGTVQVGGQTVHGFSSPARRGHAQAQMRTAAEILPFFAERFGPCPYTELQLAMVEARVPGGHSPPGLVYLQERPDTLRSERLADDPANFSDLPDFFLAHELAHQWWGQGAAPASYRERWLSEAWAQYAAALWIRQRRGEPAFREMMDRMARWAMRDDSAGPIHLGHRLGVLEGDSRVYRSVVYDKGAWVLHMLRGIVGDDAFFRGARAFLEHHRFAMVTTDDLRVELEQASGRDLRPYFERWVYDTGLPKVQWFADTRPAATGFETLVEMAAERLPAGVPVEIELAFGDERKVERVTLDPAGGSWTIPSATRPQRISVNEDRGLLAELARVRRPPRPSQR